MRTPLVSIITVNYNQELLTCALLDSIRRQDFHNLEIIVVDNGSAQNPEQIFRQYPEVVFVRSSHNLGFAGGNNIGLSMATGDYLFLVNNDAELTNNCIAQLVHFAENNPQVGIVSPLICYPPAQHPPIAVIQYAGMTQVNPFTGRNRTIGAGETNRGQFDIPRQTAYAHGAAMFMSSNVLKAVGPMREDYFLYYEELDWCERIRRAGYGVWVEPRACVWHKESSTVKGLGPIKTYYLSRNRILFMRRNISGWQFAVFLLFLMVVVLPKNILIFTWRAEWRNMDAFLQGVWWNLCTPSQNTYENADHIAGSETVTS